MSSKKKIRVLILTRYFYPGYKAGGTLRSLTNLVNRLDKKIDFYIIASDRDFGDVKGYKKINKNDWNNYKGAKIFYLTPNVLSFFMLVKLINEIEHDVIYINSFFDFLFSIWPCFIRKIGLLSKKPVILAPKGEFSAEALRIKKVKKDIYMCMAKFFCFHKEFIWQASSKYEEKEISNYSKSGKIVIVPDMPVKIEKEEIKLKHNSISPLKICFLSRICSIKNLEFCFKVLNKVNARIIFDIYGPKQDMEYWSKCEELIDALPNSNIVEYKGVVKNKNVINVFSQYDLFFFPSFSENYGHVILESMLAGTPVLISNNTPWKNLESLGVGWDISLTNFELFVDAIEKTSVINADDFFKWKLHVQNYAKKITDDENILNKNEMLFVDAIMRKNI